MSRNYRINVALTLLLVWLSGCSYVPSVTQVAEENLPQYNPKHFKDLYAQKESIENEDDLIIQALYYEQEGDLDKSHHLYTRLYELTGKDEYLLREMSTALYVDKKSKNIDKLQALVKSQPTNLKAKRLSLSYYLNEKEYDKAKVVAQELLQISSSPIDFELVANPYILTQDYTKAIEYLDKAYEKTFNPDILLKITTLYANYIGDVKSAVQRLEDHRKNQECDERVCHQLLEIYASQENIQALMEIYKDLYAMTEEESYAIKIVEGYMYQKDIASAVKFLENEYENNELLYELYLAQKDYSRAQKRAEKIYQRGAGAKWLAESAMALYESSDNKNDPKMLQVVVKQLEKAISEGADEGVYFNYYGYTLINHDMDLGKGIEAVKKALKLEPENTYYLDSLAWGYYKEGRCKESRTIMKKVIDIEGLEEPEIAEHWRKIQTCEKE